MNFHPKWPGFNMALLRDIWSTHKVFIFGTFNCTEYELKEFKVEILKAEDKIFGERICSQHVVNRWGNAIKEKFATHTLYPSWLINDDVFEVMKYHFAASQWVNTLKEGDDFGNELNVICCVIPRENAVSLYDPDRVYMPSIGDIGDYLKANDSVKNVHRKEYEKKDDDEVIDVVERIKKMVDLNRLKMGEIIVLLFDRRNNECNEQSMESLTVFQCDSIDSVLDLMTNHFLSLHFNLCRRDVVPNDSTTNNIMVRSWLHYGNGNRIRFWSEQLVWFIPRLFVKNKKLSGYQMAERLYSNDYKHGFCVNLSDPVFDRFYKILTSWNHQSVNYRRTRWRRTRGIRFGLRDYVEDRMSGQSILKLTAFWNQNGYSSDDILDDIDPMQIDEDSNIAAVLKGDDGALNELRNLGKEYGMKPDAECTIDHPLEIWRCLHAQEMLTQLKLFQSENFDVNGANICDFDQIAMIRGLDHLAAIHNLFSIGNKKRIQHYFQKQIHCELGAECTVLHQHCSRRREIDDEHGDGQNEEKEEMNEFYDQIDSILVVTLGALCSAHCYLLHSEETLYRLSGQNNKFELNPFGTAVLDEVQQEDDGDEEKKEDIPSSSLSIDFGVSVLQWLPFGVNAMFKSFEEEMVSNPASTLSPQLFDQFRMECIAQLDGDQWTEDNLDELMCLKVYSDCTKLQNKFRRAYWARSPIETKRAFYQWALKMYQTFLFHAQPIPQSQSGGPKTLYHGLNKLFQVDDTAPTYQGPFSTTGSRDVANGFANGQGLIFSVKGSYSNPIRFILGIDMIRISCFKHEREILLYSQTLQIKATETFEKDDGKLVDHFMNSLKSTKKPIVDGKVFCRGIGVQFKAEWIPLIVRHPMLTLQSEYRKRIVIRRLVEEFGFGKWMLCLQCRDHLKVSEAMIQNEWTENFYFMAPRDSVSLCVFVISVNGVLNARKYQFDNIWCIRFPLDMLISPLFNQSASGSAITVFVGPSDGSIDMMLLKEFSVNHPMSRYELNREDPLQIDILKKPLPFDSNSGDHGVIQIKCTSDIVIAPNGGINADGAGLKEENECVVYDQYSKRKNHGQREKEWDVNRVIILRFGTLRDSENQSLGAGGGIISLQSFGDIINHGVLSCRGIGGDHFDGGSICLCADGVVMNRGQIDCGRNGLIKVQCREFVNEGSISSETEIMISNGSERREIEMVMMPWNGCDLKEIELSVHKHRGHYRNNDEYHPRNLLDQKGTKSQYRSDINKPSKGDWIIFKIESESIVIPKAVIIQNVDGTWADGSVLKSIELSVGSNADSDDFTVLSVIPQIQENTYEEQYFEIRNMMMSNATLWKNDCKFIKLKVLSNWGKGEGNWFHSFSILGFECESAQGSLVTPWSVPCECGKCCDCFSKKYRHYRTPPPLSKIQFKPFQDDPVTINQMLKTYESLTKGTYFKPRSRSYPAWSLYIFRHLLFIFNLILFFPFVSITLLILFIYWIIHDLVVMIPVGCIMLQCGCTFTSRTSQDHLPSGDPYTIISNRASKEEEKRFDLYVFPIVVFNGGFYYYATFCRYLAGLLEANLIGDELIIYWLHLWGTTKCHFIYEYDQHS